MIASRDAMKTFFAPLLVATCALAAGCNTPNTPKEPPASGAEPTPAAASADVSKPRVVTPPAAPPAATAPVPTALTPTAPTAMAPSAAAAPLPASSSAGVTAKGTAACTGDSDCRTFASYCAEAPCACRALGKSDGEPKCGGGGTKVSCFVDPCMKKSAHCQSGVCLLTALPGGPSKMQGSAPTATAR